MFDDFFFKVEELRKKNEVFATATVVRREMPSSGKSGDKAIIDKFGGIIGWVGGGCVRAIILKEAEDAMNTGKARLVKVGLSPSDEKQEGVVEYPMTCLSEGSLDIFIEPFMQMPHLVVIGRSAIAKALVKIGSAAGYRVSEIAPDALLNSRPDALPIIQPDTGPHSFIVVCTQGEQDEWALEQALRTKSAYVGFVASRKKKATLFEYLENAGIDRQKVEAIRSPAGMDINAKKPEEVAVSILAEIIQVQNGLPATAGFANFKETKEESGQSKYYINPVCGIPVDINNPKHVISYKGEQIYFCCDGCKVKFESEPEKYMSREG